MEKDTRTNVIAVRLTDGELAVVRAAASEAQRTPADYCRLHIVARAMTDIGADGKLKVANRT